VEDEKPNGGSARPGKTPKLNNQNSPNQHNLNKSKTRSRRSIQPPIPDDPAHEAPTEGVHGGIPAVRGEGVHGDLKDAEQEGHVDGNACDDVHTVGGDIQAKEADDDVDHDDTNAKLVVGPEVPNQGGEDDPVLWIIETGGRKSKMTKPRLLFDNKCRSKLFEAMHENNYQEDVQYKTFHRMSDMYVMIKTFQENVMTATIKEDVVHKTFQKDKDAKAYMKNVVMPGAKMTLTTQHSCMTVKTGPKEDTKRLAITSERGERGGITKCATHVVTGNFVAVANQ
jgi:hypothetical protein